MTPRRAAVYVALLIVPAILYAFVQAGRNDLLLATRSLMGQAKKADEGTWALFYQRYRFPAGNPGEQETLFHRLWERFQDCTPREARYGGRAPFAGPDGRVRERREVVVRGSTRTGEGVTLRVDWVRHAGGWYILDFQDYDGRVFSQTPAF
jgi:hypothetical protein